MDAAIWAQVRSFIDAIQLKSGDNNAKALALSRVPHLRGLGQLVDRADAAERCSVEVRFQTKRTRGDGSPAPESILLQSDNVLLATGSRAVRLPSLVDWYDVEINQHVRCCDSDTIKSLSFLPRRVVIVGGGIIAIEFARIFAALAADVTMVVRADNLPKSLERVGIDRSLGFVLQRELIASGVRLLFESEVDGAAAIPRGTTKTASYPPVLDVSVIDSKTKAPRDTLPADLILTATGRRGVTNSLGLETMGIDVSGIGDVVVGEDLMTSAAGVYAAGDCIGAPQLASTGIAQAEAAVDTMFGNAASPAAAAEASDTEGFSPKVLLSNAARYPIGIWTMPEVAFVGLTAAAATSPPHNLDVVEGVGRYSESIRGHVHSVGTPREGEYLPPCSDDGDEAGGGPDCRSLSGPSLKLVLERAAPHRIVGVHIFGDDACELIHFGTTLVQEGKGLADILAVCFAAVTYHELYKLAALDAAATLQEDAWRALYHELDRDGDGNLAQEEVRKTLERRAASQSAIDDIIKALFAGSKGSVGIEQFVKRAQRLSNPLRLEIIA